MNKDINYIPEEEENKNKIKKVKDKLKNCEKERSEYLAGWQRARADLINYKKEQEQKIADYYRFANEGLMLEILPVLDSFEIALKHQKDEGLQQVYNQLKIILKNNGLEEIETKDQEFNPELHESVEEVESKKKPGIIIEETQKGYKLKGKVIRASKVKISK
ncbi:MAG: nucleotide exchange factor GrpE [Candidatus Portnoybacteria bacterium]|nr:nucleotide exchange factor GrpE [Candidatus Portnoybacteria bacterium]